MKYDDASWHHGGDFPADLPNSAGASHIALFVAWATLQGLASQEQASRYGKEIDGLEARTVSPVEWFAAVCDEGFTDDGLNEEGNAFARAYYGNGDGLNTNAGGYLDDYARCFPGLPSLYYAPADRDGYDRVAPILMRRLKTWRRGRWLMRLVGRG